LQVWYEADFEFMLQRPQHSLLELHELPLVLHLGSLLPLLLPPPLPGPHFKTPWLLFKSFALVSQEHVSRLAA